MTRTAVKLTCDNCGKTFTLMSAAAKQRLAQKHKFDSPECYQEYLQKNKKKVDV
jgi:predicted RNA-binding Zn-ribbon protein involved in translation (DUF1610 family)